MTIQDGRPGGVGGVPQLDRAISRRRSQPLPVRRPRNARDPSPVTVQHWHLAVVGRVPDLNGRIMRGCGQARTVRRPRNPSDPVLVTVQDGQLHAESGIPDAGGVVVRAGGESLPVGRPGHRPEPSRWPRSTTSPAPDAASHTRTVPSYETLASRCPSGDQATPRAWSW